MSDEAIEDRVCLSCYNRWTPRKEPEGSVQCTNLDCRKRTTVRLSVLEENVESVDRAFASLPAPVGEFLTPPSLRENFPKLLKSSKGVLDEADPRASDGVEMFQSILEIVDEWDEEEDVSAAVDRLFSSERD